MAITFDIPNTEIFITTGQLNATAQDLYNASKLEESSFQMMGRDPICSAEGKAPLGGGIFTEIVLTLLEGQEGPWTIRFADEATQFTSVTGGTFLATDGIGDPRPVTTNPSLTINQSISGVLVETGVSGLTAAESQALLDIDTNVATNTTDIGTINTNIGTIQTDIGTINTNIATIQTDIGTINTNIGSIQTDISAIQGDISTIQVDLSVMNRPKKNQVFNDFMFLMINENDLKTPVTGASPTGERSLDGGAFAATEGTISEVGQGIYSIDLTANDTNGDSITYIFKATGAIPRYITVITS